MLQAALPARKHEGMSSPSRVPQGMAPHAAQAMAGAWPHQQLRHSVAQGFGVLLSDEHGDVEGFRSSDQPSGRVYNCRVSLNGGSKALLQQDQTICFSNRQDTRVLLNSEDSEQNSKNDLDVTYEKACCFGHKLPKTRYACSHLLVLVAVKQVFLQGSVWSARSIPSKRRKKAVCGVLCTGASLHSSKKNPNPHQK